jgi:formylglycine-generating enzyme
MKQLIRALLCLLGFVLFARDLSAAAIVSNVAVTVRPDTKRVEVTYDLAGEPSSVGLAVSSDGGASYSVPVVSVSGHVGEGVSPGTGKKMVWDAGTDWPDQFTSQLRVRVGAWDLKHEASYGFVKIPEGVHQMGNVIGDTDITDAPVTTVTLSGFYLAVNHTTQAQWDGVWTWATSNGYTDLAAGEAKSSDHPVHTVSWYEVVKWLNAASEKAGLTPCYRVGGAVFRTGSPEGVTCDWAANGYRLPTEAEWEVAARGGLTGKRFPWGDTISHSEANYFAAYPGAFYDVGPRGYNPAYVVGSFPFTAPVGSFASNGYGLNDIAGNMRQWCWDGYQPGYVGGTDPRGPNAASSRVLRGGSWSSVASGLRCARRNKEDPGYKDDRLGFRVARGRIAGAGIGSESSLSGLDTRTPVAITAQPEGATVTEGDPVVLSVTAIGTGPLTYQWKKGGADVANATGADLSIPSPRKADSGSYTVVVSNVLGSVTSEAASLIVLKPGRFTFERALYLKDKGWAETAVQVTVRRLVDTSEAASVEVVASSETLPESAYALPSRPMRVRWAAWDAEDKTVNLVLRAGRAIAPGGESIRLRLMNPTGAELGDIVETTVALTHREPGVLVFESASVERVKPETGDLTVALAVRRIQGGTGAVSVEVVPAGGTASEGDYSVAQPAVLTWGPGDTAPKTFPVLVKATAAVPAEGKTLVFRLRNPSGGAELGGPGSATLVVRPMGLAGVAGFASSTFAAAKAASGESVAPVSVVRSGGGNGAVSVQVTAAGGTAVPGTDYALPPGPVVLSWGDDELGAKTVPIRILEGAQIGAAGKTILLNLVGPTGGLGLGVLGSATLKIASGDTPGPTVVVDAPAQNARVFGKSAVIRGQAMDVSGVDRVTVALNGGEPVDAALTPGGDGNTSGWMVTLWPEQGVNTARVRAYDRRGNVSAETTRQFTFGYVRSEYAGTYDGLLVPAATPQELAAQAGLANAFEGTRGRGLLNVTVSTAGAVSGRMLAGGAEHAFKGVLKRDGTVVFSGGAEKWALKKVEGRGTIALGDLSLRVREGEPALVAGELTVTGGAAVLARLEADKHIFSEAKVLPPGMRRVPEEVLNPSYENGRYTVLFDPRLSQQSETYGSLTPSAFPQAAGSGRLTLSGSGEVKIVGRLADGVPFSYSNRLSPTLRWPVYVPLYGRRGFLAGQVQFDPTPADSDAACEAMDWVRPVGWPAPYAAGWPEGITVPLVASKYVAPVAPSPAAPTPANPYGVFGPGVPVNTVADAIPYFVPVDLVLSGGGLEGEAVLAARLSGANVLTPFGGIPQGSPFLGARWTFVARDGGFRGSFVHPATGKPVPFTGVVFQKTGRATGSFEFLPATGPDASVGSAEVLLPSPPG